MKCWIIFGIIFLSFSVEINGQFTEKKNWCMSTCDGAGDEMKNTKSIFMNMRAPSVRSTTFDKKVHFPIRAVFITDKITSLEKSQISITIENLNKSFKDAAISFSLESLSALKSGYYLEDLMSNNFETYNSFSLENDSEKFITLYVFPHGRPLCNISETSISCSRTGGFSYILSEKTNNVVLSRFDILDFKIVAHEFGHFFGLYHTFEEDQFGKDNFDKQDCMVLGDCLCDTPPDPGAIFEVYVNYTLCEMSGYANSEGFVYKPKLNNYMTYYKPCYLTEYEFSKGQLEVLNYAANSNFRIKFAKP